MKKILKIGDMVYALSLQHFAPSFYCGFPQREQFLLDHASNVECSFFRHEVLRSIEDVVRERQRLTEYLLSKRFDYVMVDNPLSALIIERSADLPILFDCIDWYDERYLKEFGVNKGYYLLRYGLLDLLERASKVIAQSPVILQALQAWGLKTPQTRVIPNGYDGRFFYPYTPEKVNQIKNSLAERFKVDFTDKEVVVFTGKLSSWYDNIKLIAEAVEEHQIFLVVGDGPILNEIPDRPNIVKCGAVTWWEIPDYTNTADVLVFPVDVDCSPIAISEYLAVGKPIVMGKGRMGWLLRDGETGSMVDNNVYAWRAGIRRSLASREEFGRNSLKLAENLTWQALSCQFSDFLSQ